MGLKKSDGISIVGADEFAKLLTDPAQKDIEALTRAYVVEMAAMLREKIKARTPTDSGNLKKSGKHRRKRSYPNNPQAMTFFDVGKDARHDGFYWRFVEHGTQAGKPGSSSKPARPFVQPARDEMRREMPDLVKKAVLKVWTRRVKRQMKQAAK